MSDAALAASLMDEMIGSRGVRERKASMLERAYQMLVRQNRANWEGRQRRVRSIFDGEPRRVDNFEIEDMRAIIEARKRHAAYREETAALVARALGREADQDR